MALNAGRKHQIRSFVLAVIRAVAGTAGLGDRVPFEESAEWLEAIRVAQGYGSLMLFAMRVLQAPWREDLPEAARLLLEEKLSRELLLRAVSDEQLQTALNALWGARIEVKLQGAAALARCYYPDPFMRSVETAELQIAAAQILEAQKVLGAAGFRVLELAAGEFRLESSRIRRAQSIRMTVAEDLATTVPFQQFRISSSEQHFIEIISSGPVLGLTPVVLNDLEMILSRRSSDFDWEQVLWGLAERRSMVRAWHVLSLIARDWPSLVPESVLIDLKTRLGSLRRRAVEMVAGTVPRLELPEERPNRTLRAWADTVINSLVGTVLRA